VQWQLSNLYGYRILRYKLAETKGKPAEIKQLGPDTIRPFSLERFKASFPVEHKYAPIAVQALYGATFNTVDFESDITSFRRATQEQEMRYAFALFSADMDKKVAEALGLYHADKDVKSGEQYLYKIINLNPEKRDTLLLFADMNQPDSLHTAPDLLADEQLNRIELSWDTELAEKYFSAYWIERSDDQGANWKKINRMPFVLAQSPSAHTPDYIAYYTDTTITRNYYPYHYRLIGLTPFGEESLPCQTLVAMGRDRTPPDAPEIISIKDVNGKMVLNWELKNPPADLKGFMVGRAVEIGGPFEYINQDMLGAKVRSFKDEKPEALDGNYYVVFAVDTAMNASASLPAYGYLIDSIPPSKPMKPKGYIDTSGVVHLNWRLGPEQDILGYRVFFANATYHEFSNITPVPVSDTTFRDTISLNTLAKFIHYQIVAVDRNYNHSERSEVLTLRRPDFVPPVSPLFSDYLVSDSAVYLKYIPSSSDDVAQYRLMRKTSDQSEYKLYDTWKVNEKRKHEYVDRNVKGVTYYQYVLQAVDSAGNHSAFSPSVEVRVYEKMKIAPINRVNALFHPDLKKVNIDWTKPDAPVDFYVIYRSKDGSNFSSHAAVEAEKLVFEDADLIGKGQYQYAVKAVFKQGGESKLAKSNIILWE
jgi:hypothetical protein